MIKLTTTVVGILAVVAGGVTTYFVADKPPLYVLEAQMSATPDDAGMFQIVGVISHISPADAGPTPPPPDAAVYPDASPGPQKGGIYDPPSTKPTPDGEQLTVTQLGLPGPLATTNDPTFHTTVRRLLAVGKHEYSQLQPLSYDNKYILLFNESNAYVVYDYVSMTPIASDTAWAAARWIPGTHKLVYILGVPVRVMSYDVDTKAIALLYQVPAPFAYDYTSETQEELSEDGRWISMYPHNGNGVNKTMMAVDLKAQKPGAQISVDALYTKICAKDPTYGAMGPDFVAVTPLGTYLGVQWKRDGSTRCSGLELFNIQTGGFVGQVHTGHNHGSWAVGADGKEGYVTVTSASSLNPSYPEIIVEWLNSTPTNLRLFAWDPPGSAFGHVSCLGPHGTCLVSGEGKSYAGGPLLPGLGELYFVNFDGSTLRVAHHRSTQANYWTQPKAALSKDGHHVIYTSDWGNPAVTAPFAMDLP